MMNLNSTDLFEKRHIGPNNKQTQEMLKTIGVKSLDELIEQTVPSNIRLKKSLNLPNAISEYEYIQDLEEKASKNQLFKSYIGLGYYNTITPKVIQRNIFENPGWYTQYTPYQAEISQGRLEALLNFQTMISDLTGMPLANASLLDEGTAAAEAMQMFYNFKNKRKIVAHKFFVSHHCFPQTIDILKTRAKPMNIKLVLGCPSEIKLDDSFFGALLQYPNANGNIIDYKDFVHHAHYHNVRVCMAADILSLALLKTPSQFDIDCVVGNTQRLGIPMGYGGPHAAFFATKEIFKRLIPGRIIGVSIDRNNNSALRMALQTREQHIKRDRATSNICTAQALLAIMAGMYAVYHGKKGLKDIALRIHQLTCILKKELQEMGYTISNKYFFDTLSVSIDKKTIQRIKTISVENQINFRYQDNNVCISLDETVLLRDLTRILHVFANARNIDFNKNIDEGNPSSLNAIPKNLKRETDFLSHNVFSQYHSETKLMRYIKSLENKDLSLTASMIPLGSCTMKLNAATELMPVSWASFAHIHPFVPIEQVAGYQQIIKELEHYLNICTGFAATSLQPNSGAQGEYAGLLVIKAFHQANGNEHRNIALIPSSAHGTNPASAVMAGMKVVVVNCDSHGNIEYEDLKKKAQQYEANLACLMITYPSTHGVFEHKISDVCQLIHQYGGQVYMDGANMNAQVGLTSPAHIGADVCHLNLHKTFAIPHGGGGPGMGPICVASHLAPYLPSHSIISTGGDHAISALSSAPWGSASILLISYAYIKLLGRQGIVNATKYAILNANYIKARLEKYYNVLYVGKENKRVAHELILDFRPFKHTLNIEVEDIAKRLIDYSFHAPTVSFPVAGTLMIEPTESEDKAELDRFCDAMIRIREEIHMIEKGEMSKDCNVLKNAPHTLQELTHDKWTFEYSRELAAYPLETLHKNKFWASVNRVNNSYGDRNLICTCPSIESYR